MNCDEYKELRDRYLQGNATMEEEQAMESHLESCAACRQLLDEDILNNEPLIKGSFSQPVSYALDERKQARILRRAKYKNRFSLALFLLALFIVLNIAGMLASSFYFNRGAENSRLYRVQKTAATLIEFTFPNVSTQPEIPAPSPPWYFSSMGWGQNRLDIKPYFAAQGTYVLQKLVGKEPMSVGNLQVRQFFNFINSDWTWQDGAYKNYLYFIYPTPNSAANDQRKQSSSPAAEEVWQTLTILPEGTVAEMAVSFDAPYRMEEIKEILKGYDLNICWYAVYTGLEDSEDLNQRGEPLSAFHGVWGFSDFNQNPALDRQKYFADGMQFLAENQAAAQKLCRGNPANLQLDKRNDYIQKNGIKVYGAVVTGPSKELLKLRELSAIRHPALGEVALWNWFNRSFSGEMY
ncbi:MAG: anti sigma factor C-terminal domain-containing protein [Syntrophomonadaceae bacterium]|nr:anti sigma factor C-terminal domain-containing protein [Syntrophomonadaceae bacterium]